MSNFRPIDCDTGFLLPPSVDVGVPEKHLARFVVEVIDGLDFRAMSGSYRGSGSASYHPALLLGILIYGYATGFFRAASWSGRVTTRWRSALSRRTNIQTTTRSRRSVDVLLSDKHGIGMSVDDFSCTPGEFIP